MMPPVRAPERDGWETCHGSVQRLEARFGLERLPGLDLFDGVLGAFQADVEMLPVDFNGSDLIPGFEQTLHILQRPGQLLRSAHARRGGSRQPAALQGFDNSPGFLLIYAICLAVPFDSCRQVPASGQPLDIIHGSDWSGGLAGVGTRQHGRVAAKFAAYHRAGSIGIQRRPTGGAIQRGGLIEGHKVSMDK